MCTYTEDFVEQTRRGWSDKEVGNLQLEVDHFPVRRRLRVDRPEEGRWLKLVWRTDDWRERKYPMAEVFSVGEEGGGKVVRV